MKSLNKRPLWQVWIFFFLLITAISILMSYLISGLRLIQPLVKMSVIMGLLMATWAIGIFKSDKNNDKVWSELKSIHELAKESEREDSLLDLRSMADKIQPINYGHAEQKRHILELIDTKLKYVTT